MIEFLKSFLFGIVEGNHRMAADQQHRTSDSFESVCEIRCFRRILQYV